MLSSDPSALELQEHIQLNLRISKAQNKAAEGASPKSNNEAKFMVSNYTGNSAGALIKDQELREQMSNLNLENFIQPLFRVEKTAGSTRQQP